MGMLESRGFDSPRTSLSQDEEKQFKNWFSALPWYEEFVKKYGETPNPDDPSYDYRAAYKAGMTPERYEYDGTYHWGSKTPDGQWLKSKNHPTAWMEDFMQSTGTDPNALGIKTPLGGFLYYRGLKS